jgi:hypothetical protein
MSVVNYCVIFCQLLLCVVDDLMSLLDAGIHADHPGVIIDSDAMFGENMMFGYSGLRRTALRSRAGVHATSYRCNETSNSKHILHHMCQ